jgi:hypothetical protein
MRGNRKDSIRRCGLFSVNPLAAHRLQLFGGNVMAAIQGIRHSSSVNGMLVVAVAAALLVGGASGYLIRGMSSQVSGQVTVAGNPPALAADQLPAWVQKYNAPAEATRFKVDDLIASLDYAPVRTADLPAWVQQYMAPAEAPRFKVDDLIRSLDYAPAGAARFKADDFIASVSGPSRTTTGTAAIDPVTGRRSGSVEDGQIRTLLTQSGYEGGGTVVHRVTK